MVERIVQQLRRIERSTAPLRVLVTLLVAVHVALVGADLANAGLLVPAGLALAAMTVSSVIGLVARARTPWPCAALDALALVAVARITIAVDPTATLVWSFLLWVPFSIAVVRRAVPTALGVATVAVLVPLAAALDVGPSGSIPFTWGNVIVPVLLIVVAGAATLLVTSDHRRSDGDVRRRLRDEQERALLLLEADDRKNTFLAAVSHELRTPLTSIIGFGVTLIDRPDIDPAQRETMLRTVLDEAEQLEGLIENLLDLDRLTRGKTTLNATPADPARVADDVVARVERRSGRAIDRSFASSGVLVLVDVLKLERIVENLATNAVKYTPSDVRVGVSLELVGGDVLRIRVDDAGPGIAHELRATIFEPFRRGADVGVAGTGIGLSLVDHFARMHGGSAHVTDSPAGGSRFEVLLRVEPAQLGASSGAGEAVLSSRDEHS